MFWRKKIREEDAKIMLVDYLKDQPEALEYFVTAIEIYTMLNSEGKIKYSHDPHLTNRIIKLIKGNPITEAFAEALYEFKEDQKRSGKEGLEDIVICEYDPDVCKVDPHVASTIAAVGEMLKKGKKVRFISFRVKTALFCRYFLFSRFFRQFQSLSSSSPPLL